MSTYLQDELERTRHLQEAYLLKEGLAEAVAVRLLEPGNREYAELRASRCKQLLHHLICEVCEATAHLPSKPWLNEDKVAIFNGNRADFVEELADVYLLWSGACAFADITAEEIQSAIDAKRAKNYGRLGHADFPAKQALLP